MKKLLCIAILGSAACVFPQTNGLTALHPGYTITDLQPSGRRFFVGGLDTFSDGRLAVCSWGNPGDVWILGSPTASSAAGVQPVQFAKGLRQLLGCKVVHDTLYVMQMDELTQLVDHGQGQQGQRIQQGERATSPPARATWPTPTTWNISGDTFYAALSSDVRDRRHGLQPLPAGPFRLPAAQPGQPDRGALLGIPQPQRHGPRLRQPPVRRGQPGFLDPFVQDPAPPARQVLRPQEQRDHALPGIGGDLAGGLAAARRGFVQPRRPALHLGGHLQEPVPLYRSPRNPGKGASTASPCRRWTG